MTVSEEQLQSLFAQLQKRMVDNGDWDKILLTLTRELNEAGWIDEVKNQCKELAKQSNPPMSFQVLLDATTPIANEQLVLFKKKGLIEALIRKSLDAQVES
ncbi:hypothetical protein BJ322DRAFT_1109473 [Thelephora terrestris]|uniref:Transcription and mRNA export factor SUS1 n=1 Tax=Thelephora terrestris TaxID=56493 RepID=A0A9P6L6U6_9AGAM|nr:hypothetical protein BJ322DRAFT_1109473 [Thelephora terrestris]